MRTVSCKTLLLAAAAAVLFTGAPVQAQQYAGTRNAVIGTVGDLPPGLLAPRTGRGGGINLRFGPRALFFGSESFPGPSTPRPFIFILPNFGDVEGEFADVTYEQYLDRVAAAYKAGSRERYKALFLNSNVFTNSNGLPLIFGFEDLGQRYDVALQFGLEAYNSFFTDGLYPANSLGELFQALSDDAFDRVHQPDFIAGGGFLPLPPPTVPNPGGFRPLVPANPPEDAPPANVPPVDAPPADTPPVDTPGGDSVGVEDLNDIAELATQIADSIDDPELKQDLIEAVASTAVGRSVSEAPGRVVPVSSVPEPATLGLLTLGVATLLNRRR